MNRRRFFWCLGGAPVAGMSVMFVGDLNPAMSPSEVNESARTQMVIIRRWRDGKLRWLEFGRQTEPWRIDINEDEFEANKNV